MFDHSVLVTSNGSTRYRSLEREEDRLRTLGWCQREIMEFRAAVFFAWTGRAGVVPDLNLPEQQWDNTIFYCAEHWPHIPLSSWGNNIRQLWKAIL